jgi:hypothetical protein
MIDRPLGNNNSPTNDLPVLSGQNSSQTISRSVARATLFRLEEAGSQIPGRVRDQIEHLYADLLQDLGHSKTDNMILVTPDQLRGIVASALITGAAQASLPDNEPEVADMPPENATDEPMAPAMGTA